MHVRHHLVGAILASILLFSVAAMAAEEPARHPDPGVAEGTTSMEDVYLSVGMAVAAALTASVSILGAGAAVGKIGSAALGSAAEHPELLTRSLLFVALAEGLAVLGFAVAMLIVMKIP